MKPQHLLLALPISLSYDTATAFTSSSGVHSIIQQKHDRIIEQSTVPSSRIGMRDTNVVEEQTFEMIEQGMNNVDETMKILDMVGGSIKSVGEAEVAHGMPWSNTIGKTNHEDPLLYMPFWEWQMEFMKDSLTNLRPNNCVEEFEYNENVDKKARIVNQCYQSDEYRKIRMTYYDAGDSTQVFNSVWYPDPAYNLPVLGIDLLSFNRKKFLAIVDFQPLHDDESDHARTYEHRLQPIKDKYESLKGRMSSKFYDETQFFSQQMLFARFDDEGIVTKDLLPAFQQYVELHTQLVAETSPSYSIDDKKFVLERQTEYDTYSAERDPATALFANMFGKEWADEFVFDFLFSLSERTEGDTTSAPVPGGGAPRR